MKEKVKQTNVGAPGGNVCVDANGGVVATYIGGSGCGEAVIVSKVKCDIRHVQGIIVETSSQTSQA